MKNPVEVVIHRADAAGLRAGGYAHTPDPDVEFR